MRLLFVFLLMFTTKNLFAEEVSIIELHSTKSLDQLVLDQETINIEKNEIEDTLEQNTEENNQDEQSLEISSNYENEIIDVSNFWDTIDINKINFYLNNINKINSPPLYNEFINLMITFNLDNNQNKNEIIFLFIKKLVELGEIQKAYSLIKGMEFLEDNLIFYKTIELNYLFSTYQLNDACELKNEFSSQNLKLDNFYLEKTDIFCLVMEDKLNEAELLNSILVETETVNDEYFQSLLNLIVNGGDEDKNNTINLPTGYSENLIFLYSAMHRIAELPLGDKFLEIDPNNLSIPIILSNASKMELRLKAANKAYNSNLISVESLAALYQSVDFNSEQLNNSVKTLQNLSGNNELMMAYYFQLANIQIFPSSRLSVVLDFWKFAESIGLEKISYKLTDNIVKSLEPSIDNSNFGAKIATALIHNEEFERALKWIIFAENSNVSNAELEKVKFLYQLYQSDDGTIFIQYLKNKYQTLENDSNSNLKEILYVLLNVLDTENNYNSLLTFDKVIDERMTPTIYINSEIEKSIINKDELNLFMLLLVSINDKEWNQIHPEHLKLVLEGIKFYKNSELLKNTLLNIFNNTKIF
ncbi:MAG: hypothetical protein CMP16_01880 [Rickettsiales bacterium]|nr:hypothetical protein [Rickettsiales bacterium]